MSQIGTSSATPRPVAGTAASGAVPVVPTPTDQAAGNAPRRDGSGGGQAPPPQAGAAAPPPPPHGGPAVTISGALTALYDGQPVDVTVEAGSEGQIVLRLPEARLSAALPPEIAQAVAASTGDLLSIRLVETDPGPEILILSRNGESLPTPLTAGVTIQPIAEPALPTAALIALRRLAAAPPAPITGEPAAAPQPGSLQEAGDPAPAPIAPEAPRPVAVEPERAATPAPTPPATPQARPATPQASPAGVVGQWLEAPLSAAQPDPAAPAPAPPRAPSQGSLSSGPPDNVAAGTASRQTIPPADETMLVPTAAPKVSAASPPPSTAPSELDAAMPSPRTRPTVRVAALPVPAPAFDPPPLITETGRPAFTRAPAPPVAVTPQSDPPAPAPIRYRPPPLILPELTQEAGAPARPPVARQTTPAIMPAVPPPQSGVETLAMPAPSAARAAAPAVTAAAPTTGSATAATAAPAEPEAPASRPARQALPPIEIEPLPPPDAPPERRAASAWQALWAAVRSDDVVGTHLREMLEPRAGGRLAGGLAFLMTALRGGALRNLVGDDAPRIDRPSRADGGRTVSAEFGELTRIAEQRSPDGWRASPLAMLDNGMIQPVMLYVHRPPRRRKSDPDPMDQAQRFMLDLRLSRTGPLRIDGLLRPKSLDVIVRTERAVPSRVQRDLREVFGASLDGSGLGGSLNFQKVDRMPPPPMGAGSQTHQAVLA